jgi:hypothetical protein
MARRASFIFGPGDKHHTRNTLRICERKNESDDEKLIPDFGLEIN